MKIDLIHNKIFYLILLGVMFLIPKDVFAYEVSVSYETDGYIYNSASTLLETPKKSGGGSWNSNLNPNRNGIYSNFFTNKLNNINGINSDSFYNIYGHINISRILPSPSCVDCSSPEANINFLEEFYYDYKATNTYTNVKCRLNNIQVGVSQVSADFTCNNVRLNTSSQGFRAIYHSSMLSWIGFSTTLDIVEVGSNSEVVKGLEDMKKEQEKTNDKLDEIQNSDISDSDKEMPDDSSYKDYSSTQDELLDKTKEADLDSLDVGLDVNSSSWVWDTLTSLIQSHSVVFGMVIAILSIGVIKLVLGR